MKYLIVIAVLMLTAISWDTKATIYIEDTGSFQVIKSMNCADAPAQVAEIQWLHKFALKEWDELSDSVKRRVMLRINEMQRIQELCPTTLEAHNDSHK